MIYFRWQVNEMLKGKDDQISILKEQIENLTEQIEMERERAQNAIDQVLVIQGASAITPPNPRERKSRDASGILKSFTTVGQDMDEVANAFS